MQPSRHSGALSSRAFASSCWHRGDPSRSHAMCHRTKYHRPHINARRQKFVFIISLCVTLVCVMLSVCAAHLEIRCKWLVKTCTFPLPTRYESMQSGFDKYWGNGSLELRTVFTPWFELRIRLDFETAAFVSYTNVEFYFRGWYELKKKISSTVTFRNW
jgi:hypothetical protein